MLRIEWIIELPAGFLESEMAVPKVKPGLRSIGNYQLLKKIATGATALVYEATDTRSQNRVALKVMRIRKEEKIERDRVEHWLHEAVIVSQLDHDNIVKIHCHNSGNNIIGPRGYLHRFLQMLKSFGEVFFYHKIVRSCDGKYLAKLVSIILDGGQFNDRIDGFFRLGGS